MVTQENNDSLKSSKKSSSSLLSRNLSNPQLNNLESQRSSNGNFKQSDFQDTITKLDTVKEASSDVFDTVDRAKPRKSSIDVHQERSIPEKAPNSFKDDQDISVNNNITNHRNANSNAHFWNKPNHGTIDQAEAGQVVLTGREEKIYSFSSDSEELPSFSSSVTDEGEMREVIISRLYPVHILSFINPGQRSEKGEKRGGHEAGGQRRSG